MSDSDCGGDDRGRGRGREPEPPKIVQVFVAHSGRDELGVARFRAGSVRALMSGDLPSLWLVGCPSMYALAPMPCEGCGRGIFSSRLHHATGARLDVLIYHGSFALLAHVCPGRAEREGVVA